MKKLMTTAIFLGLLGSFGGGLLSTALLIALWEDNYPPPTRIAEEVCQRHLAIIGISPRTPLTKRFFDISLSLLGLILAAPIWS